MAFNQTHKQENKEFEEKVIQIARVSKKTKGGNQIGFSVLMVVGDKKGNVGVGLGKAKDVVSSIKKGIKKAKKRMIKLPMDGTTIPFKIDVKKGAGRVLLKPAPTGTGVIAGGPVRAVLEAAGVRDISAKILGSENQASSVYATFEALKQIRDIVKVREIKLRSISEIEEEEKQKAAQLLKARQQQTKTAETSKPVKDTPQEKVKVKKVIAKKKVESKKVSKTKVIKKVTKKITKQKVDKK